MSPFRKLAGLAPVRSLTLATALALGLAACAPDPETAAAGEQTALADDAHPGKEVYETMVRLLPRQWRNLRRALAAGDPHAQPRDSEIRARTRLHEDPGQGCAKGRTGPADRMAAERRRQERRLGRACALPDQAAPREARRRAAHRRQFRHRRPQQPQPDEGRRRPRQSRHAQSRTRLVRRLPADAHHALAARHRRRHPLPVDHRRRPPLRPRHQHRLREVGLCLRHDAPLVAGLRGRHRQVPRADPDGRRRG